MRRLRGKLGPGGGGEVVFEEGVVFVVAGAEEVGVEDAGHRFTLQVGSYRVSGRTRALEWVSSTEMSAPV